MAATAVSLVMLALSAGAGVAIWQARRAERRFADVRKLANTFLFDFDDAIRNVSGTTKARLLVVNTARQYLDRLASEAGGDRQLLRELADSYKKLGDIQGKINGGNVGQYREALASYGKGLAIRDRLGDEQSTNPKTQAGYLFNLVELATLERFAGNPSEAGRLRAKSIQLADTWIGSNTNDPELLTAAAFAYGDLSHAQRLSEQFEPAAASVQKNLELLARAYQLDRANVARVGALASGHVSAGYVELDAGRYAGSGLHRIIRCEQ